MLLFGAVGPLCAPFLVTIVLRRSCLNAPRVRQSLWPALHCAQSGAVPLLGTGSLFCDAGPRDCTVFLSTTPCSNDPRFLDLRTEMVPV